MMHPPRPGVSVDAIHRRVLEGGEDRGRQLAIVREADWDDLTMLAVLRRAVPVQFLEAVANVPPWSDRPRVQGGVVANPKTPRALAQRLLPYLFWSDLAGVAQSPRVAPPVRVRAEGLLKERIPELRVGDRMTLARQATTPVLLALICDSEPKVLASVLKNPRLREEDLVGAIRSEQVQRSLLEQIAASPRWSERYAVRLGLVMQRRTPLALALAQLTSLLERDLRTVAISPDLPPLIQRAAQRVASGAG